MQTDLFAVHRDPVLRATFNDEDDLGDAFAGGGGASLAQWMALGKHPSFAINHDAEAMAMHEANHPKTKHYIENIYAVDPDRVIGKTTTSPGRRISFMWFSPDCTHFSTAKGGKPRNQKIRGLAWVVVRWAAKAKPTRIVVENVSEFLTWGPLHQTHVDGCKRKPDRQRRGTGGAERFVCSAKNCHFHKPIRSRRGETFRHWVRKLQRLGYTVDWRVLRACDFGAPTTRKRIYIVATRDGVMPRFPVASHGPGRTPYKTAAECIDWTIPCPSIFDRSSPLADKTLARIARGVRKFVIDAKRPFVMHVTHGSRTHDIDHPMPTVTGAHRGEIAVVSPIVVKAKTHGGGGNDAKSGAEPLGTITTSKRGEFAIVTPYLVPATHGDNRGKPDARSHSIEEPMRTITTLGAQQYLAVPYLVHRSNGERAATATAAAQEPRIYDIERPLGTVVAQGAKHALCTAFLAKHYGGNESASGGTALTSPVDTITAQDHHSLVSAHLVRYNGERRDGEARGSDVADPLPTQDTSNRFGLVACHLTKFYGTSTGAPIDEPAPTITGTGWHLGAVAAFLVRYNGTSQPQSVDAPISTVDTRDRFGLVTVSIDGEEYVIVDIGMRMLTPRELFRAQGFPDSYVIDPLGPSGKPLTKTAQVRMCGNSVSPPMGAAMVRAVCEAA